MFLISYLYPIKRLESGVAEGYDIVVSGPLYKSSGSLYVGALNHILLHIFLDSQIVGFRDWLSSERSDETRWWMRLQHRWPAALRCRIALKHFGVA